MSGSGDGKDLVDWLEHARSIEASGRGEDQRVGKRRARRGRPAGKGVPAMAARVRHRHMGKPLRATAAAVAPLNELLARDSSFQRVEVAGRDAEDGRRLLLRRVHRWESPGELLQPIAEAAADLICNQDFRLIRSCEGSACTLVFLDRTKAHTRRWCSMAVCGNLAKAAAHRARRGRNEERGSWHPSAVGCIARVGHIDRSRLSER